MSSSIFARSSAPMFAAVASSLSSSPNLFESTRPSSVNLGGAAP